MEGENEAKGGLIDDRFEPKPAHLALDRLINRPWKTRLDAKTDAQGVVRFRGFHGRYAVRVGAGDGAREVEFELSQGPPATQRIEWRRRYGRPGSDHGP